MFESDEGSVRPAYGLYSYQRQVLGDILRVLSEPDRRGVAHLPTGAGKTRVAAHAVCSLLNEEEKGLAVWLACSEELCEQAAEQLAVAWVHLGRRNVGFERYWGQRKASLRRLAPGFLVAGLAKLRAAADKDGTLLAQLAQSAAVVVFDEAHQAVASTYSFVTEQLCSARPALLGLTATPGRTAMITAEDHQLAAMFSNKKVSIDPKGHSSPVTYLIHNRYLAEPRFVPIQFDRSPRIDEPAAGMDYSRSQLDAIGRCEDRTLTIVNIARAASIRHPRTIVFCPSVESAEASCQALVDQRVAADVVTASTPADDRSRVIERFKEQDAEHRVICNYGVLTAGFDAPKTRCVVIARPTTSLVLYSQMAGRAMRGPRAGGNRHAEILTVADTNLPGFGSVTEAFANWEELWSVK